MLKRRGENAPLWVRSQTELNSRNSLPGSSVEAVVIQDYYSPGGFSIPMGSEDKGKDRRDGSERIDLLCGCYLSP